MKKILGAVMLFVSVPALSVEPPLGFEVEMRGRLLGSVKAPRYIAYLSPTPCDVHTLETAYVKAVGHPDPADAKRAFYLEPVSRKGERQFLCAAALDGTGRHVLAFGSYAKNPIVFEAPEAGEDDADMDGLTVTLRKLTAPVTLGFERF